MAENPITYALTTKQRVKDRMNLSVADHDTLIDRIIAAITDFVEGECGGRRFMRTTYTNEVYTIFNTNQKYLALNHIPIGTITAVQYRAGLRTSPTWTNFAADDWDMLEDGKNGLVRVWGISTGANAIRVSYTAGYLIDFANAGSPTAHTLPADLSDLAERLVIKVFKRRNDEGKASESFEGGTVQWKDHVDDLDKRTLDRYKKIPQFV